MITVREAKHIAQDWVEAEAPKIPKFRGAFLIGSLNFRNEEESLPPTSDVDVRIVVDIEDPELIYEQGLEQQILTVQGITLDVGFDPIQYFSQAEKVLADFRFACHFSVPNILSDTSGDLSKIQKTVAVQYPRKKWVRTRIEGVRDLVLSSFDNLKAGTVEECMMHLPLAVMGIAQIPALANLMNPTMKKCFVVFQKLMENHGKQVLFESLLRLFGSHSMDREDVEKYLEDLSITFDRAVEIIRSPSLGDFVNIAARPVVIDGSWEMVNDGFHREAMFWIATMRAICQATIQQDASEEEQILYAEQYMKLLADLGLSSSKNYQKRAEDGAHLLDEVMWVAKQMVETNEKIVK